MPVVNRIVLPRAQDRAFDFVVSVLHDAFRWEVKLFHGHLLHRNVMSFGYSPFFQHAGPTEFIDEVRYKTD